MLKLLATTALATITVSSIVSAAISSAETTPAPPAPAAEGIVSAAPVPEVPAPAPVPDLGPTVGLDPVVTVVGADREQLALVDDALDSFRAAGLALPNLEVIFHDDPAECRGHDGLFQAQYTPWRLLVCSDLAFVVTHEMAHAWEAATLDDADRLAYTEYREMTTWDDTAAEWGDRAVEDAAFVVQQNLMAGNVRLDTPVWAERTQAFEALTGRRSPLLPPAVPGVR